MKYGILGYPLDHSLSPKLHNAAFTKFGIDASYEKFEVKDLEEFSFNEIKGLSITIPHKEGIIKYLDEINPVASEIGAVNTVKNNGKLIGYNTDVVGFLKPLEKVDLDGEKIVVLGAGGAARAVCYGLKDHDLIILNRTLDKAKVLADEFGGEALDSLNDIKADIIVNTTSVGLNSDESLVDKEFLSKHKPLVYDIIYTETKLIKDAKEIGCQVITGMDMFIYQAIEQFKIWTGKEVEYEFFKGIVEKN